MSMGMGHGSNETTGERKAVHPKTIQLLEKRREADRQAVEWITSREAAAEAKAAEPVTPPFALARNLGDVSRVAVVDIQMPFGSMVVFMVKWALASVPALMLLGAIFGVCMIIFGGIFLAGR